MAREKKKRIEKSNAANHPEKTTTGMRKSFAEDSKISPRNISSNARLVGLLFTNNFSAIVRTSPT